LTFAKFAYPLKARVAYAFDSQARALYQQVNALPAPAEIKFDDAEKKSAFDQLFDTARSRTLLADADAASFKNAVIAGFAAIARVSQPKLQKRLMIGFVGLLTLGTAVAQGADKVNESLRAMFGGGRVSFITIEINGDKDQLDRSADKAQAEFNYVSGVGKLDNNIVFLLGGTTPADRERAQARAEAIAGKRFNVAAEFVPTDEKVRDPITGRIDLVLVANQVLAKNPNGRFAAVKAFRDNEPVKKQLRSFTEDAGGLQMPSEWREVWLPLAIIGNILLVLKAPAIDAIVKAQYFAAVST